MVARQFGNADTLMVVKSRGYGKTWLTALCCLAMGVLYPGSLIAVVSGTAEQATLIVKKIQDYFIRNPEIMREIQADGHRPVQLSRNKGVCTLKNGSKIESFSVGTMRGNRAKIVVIDESPEVKADDLDAVIAPVKNTRRDICHQRGIADYASKTISITSACLKSNYFYAMFMAALKEFSRGDPTSFACALDYRSAARVGITDMAFFLAERRKMPETKFAMEYGSIFVGAESGSMFPYDLTEGCRVLKRVELAQPTSCTSEYVMGVDLATSSERTADNAVICVLKLIELESGAYLKKLVYMRSYHGKRLDALADEVRKTYAAFPRVTRIVFDHRGLGDAFPQFLAQPWTDERGKEYPPWTLDDERTIIHNAVPMLRSVKASAQINQQLVSCLRVALEQRTLELPVASRFAETVAGEEGEEDTPTARKLTLPEKAVYLESDALQIEMGNIVMRSGAGAAVLYDVARTNQHKDRYSALAMAVRYIAEMEEERKRKLLRPVSAAIGVVSRF